MIKEAEFNENSLVHQEKFLGIKILDKNNNLKTYANQHNWNRNNFSDVILYFNTNKGTYYHNCTTGKRILDSIEKVVRKNKGYLSFFISNIESIDEINISGHFFEYDKKNDVILLYSCSFDCNHISLNETRMWSSGKLAGIMTKDGVYHQIKGMDAFSYSLIAPGIFNNDIDVTSKRKTLKYDENDYFFDYSYTINIFKKFIGQGFTDFNNKYYPFTKNEKNIETFIKGDKFFEIKEDYNFTNNQNEIDKLTKIKLKDISTEVKETISLFYNFERTDGYLNFLLKENGAFDNINKNNNFITFHNTNKNITSISKNFAFIEKVKDNVSVIRIFNTMEKNENNLGKISFDDLDVFEFSRIYVTKDKYYPCRKILKKWAYLFDKEETYYSEFLFFDYNLVCYNYKDIIGTKLEYFKKYLDLNSINIEKNIINNDNNFHQYNISRLLYFLFKYPIYEKLLKLLDDYYILEILKNSRDVKFIEKYFGKINFKEDSLSKALNCPLFITIFAAENFENKFLIFFLKEIFESDLNYLKRMNEELFFKFVEKYKIIKDYDQTIFINIIDLLSTLICKFGPHNFLLYFDYIIKEIDNINLINYIDYIEMLSELKYVVSDFDWKIKIIEKDSFEKAHKEIISIYNTFVDEKRYSRILESFNKQKINFDKYQYSDDNFSILTPANPIEIANEGISLHHCVKTYIESVSHGETIILFIRKQNELNKPFFTLEIKDEEIRQCHGFANCNTDTVPGLEDFIKIFCKEKNINYAKGCGVLAAN